MRTRFALLIALALGAVAARAVPPVETRIPSPESVLGFRPGDDGKLADWPEVVRYFRALDKASERVLVEDVGPTTEGRPFLIATITSEANMARLQEIRRDNLRLADPRGLTDEEARRIVSRGKTIVAMNYSIHSTEVGGTLAAMLFAHQLATASDAKTLDMLNRTVLLLIPSHNPDGTDIVTAWHRKQTGTAFEGTEPPVLYHHYAGHDNNRDWYMFTQAETRLTVAHLYDRWHPQIVHDVHQMRTNGARLFVPPYLDPWEPNVDPALRAAVAALGEDVAARLTGAGKAGVVVGALFDAWTPARAYPHTHGGVRILSETASAKLAGPLEMPATSLRPAPGYDPRTASWNQPLPWPGGTWRLRDIVDLQVRASLAILGHAAINREFWLETALSVNRRAIARREPFAFVIPGGQEDPLAVAELLRVMRTGGVEVQRSRSALTVAGRAYPAGSYVILMQQPGSAFAQSLLERQHYPDLRESPGGPPRRPYDVTAHTLPLLLGVEAVAVTAPFTSDLEPVAAAEVVPGKVEGAGPVFAIGHKNGDLVALGRLLRDGIDVSWVLDAFEDGGRRFPAGALLVPAKARPLLLRAAAELGVVARSITATPRVLRLLRPRVGLYQSWDPSMDEGWTRFVFEKQAGVDYETLHDADLRRGGLRERFDAIVLPSQSSSQIRNGHATGAMPEEYTGGVGAPGVAALRAFVESGGTLIALDSAAAFAIEHLSLPVTQAVGASQPPVGDFFCPGALLEVAIDPAQPLGHGLPPRTSIWFESSPAFDAPEGTVVARYGSNPLLSGWLLGGTRLDRKAALVNVPLGRGHVVLFGFRPQYRGQSWATYIPFLNALYLSASTEGR
jgi:Zinc carboxypeptidase